MQSLEGVIARLERAKGPSRRLDAEIVAAALAPRGSTINAVEDIDGWGIDYPSDEDEVAVWMCAADVPYVTAYMDAAQELIGQSQPAAAVALMATALRQVRAPEPGDTADSYAGVVARTLMAELLRAVALAQGSSRSLQDAA